MGRTVPAKEQTLTIGQFAEAAGVGVETIRFYERKGLLAAPPRPDSGYRQYPTASVRRVHFIRRAKALGFTLKEIGELLALKVERDTSCQDVRILAQAKIVDIEAKLSELQRMKAALHHLAMACGDTGPSEGCPILDALDEVEDE
jgi:MerR family copper efflux transcriptional regulator